MNRSESSEETKSSVLATAEPPAALMTVIERLASNPNVDIDKIQRLLEMQERWEVNRDKALLRHAMAEFKKNPPKIVKDRIATIKSDKGNYSWNFADLEMCVSESQIELAKYGVSHGWLVSELSGAIVVRCVLRYGLYEEIGEPLSGAPDPSGYKNAIQAKISTTTYLERITFMAAIGSAAGMPDDDGQGGPKMDKEAHDAHLTLILESTTSDALKSYFQAAIKEARLNNDAASEKQFTEAKDKRKKEIGNAIR
jgi:hypothetical protein